MIEKYGHRLFTTHLNDNFGMTGSELTWHDDAHLPPFDGIVDWKGTANRLKKAGYKGMLVFELITKNKPNRHTHDAIEKMTYPEFAKMAYERAARFGEMLDS